MQICPNCLTASSTAEILRCASCDWQAREVNGVRDFLSNAQREDKTLQDYTANYEDLAKKNIVESNIDRTFLSRQAENLATYIGDVSGASICEIGIGQGFLCDALLRKGARRIVAVDVAISYLARFVDAPKVEPYLANAESLPFGNEFDLIVSTDVMEHVLNVGSYLYCINRALVMGGRAAIRVPYREGLLNYSPHRGYGHQFGHLRSFNEDILRIYFEQAGFRVVAFHLDGYSPYMPRDRVMKSVVGRLLIMALHKYVKRNLRHWSDVIDLPRPIVRALLRPVEIVTIAEKIADVGGTSTSV